MIAANTGLWSFTTLRGIPFSSWTAADWGRLVGSSTAPGQISPTRSLFAAASISGHGSSVSPPKSSQSLIAGTTPSRWMSHTTPGTFSCASPSDRVCTCHESPAYRGAHPAGDGTLAARMRQMPR